MPKRKTNWKGKPFTSLKIDRWAMDCKVSIAVAMLAQMAVSTVEALYSICRDARAGETYSRELPYLDTEQWLGFYDRAGEISLQAYSIVLGEGMNWEEYIPGYRTFVSEKIDWVEWVYLQDPAPMTYARWVLRFRKDHRKARAVYKDHIVELEKEIRGEEEPLTPEYVRRLQQSPEVLFFMKVLWPCWTEYRVDLSELLADARAGKIDAIEKLLRLDHGFIANDPQVAEHLLRAKREGRDAWVTRYNNSLSAGAEPLGPLSSQKIKYCIAGYLHAISNYLHIQVEKMWKRIGLKFKRGGKPKNKFSYHDLLELFHAYAKDTTGKNDIDFRNNTDGAFEKAVREQRDFWEKNLIAGLRTEDQAKELEEWGDNL